jgi:hypothetical protein
LSHFDESRAKLGQHFSKLDSSLRSITIALACAFIPLQTEDIAEQRPDNGDATLPNLERVLPIVGCDRSGVIL